VGGNHSASSHGFQAVDRAYQSKILERRGRVSLGAKISDKVECIQNESRAHGRSK
jgi:hypothetical protein